MLIGAYRDLFAAIATSSAALTGLLFVVMTFRERRTASSLTAVAQEVRAAAALLSFSNALTVSLFGLVPDTNVGYPAAVVGVIGILFSAAGMRSVLASSSTRHRLGRHLVLTAVLLVTFGFELGAGIVLLDNPHSTDPLDLISYLLVVSLLIGIARAWELVGGRDTGIVSSLGVLVAGDHGSQDLPGSQPLGSTNPDAGSEASGLEPEAGNSR